jgi:acyl carrier protein
VSTSSQSLTVTNKRVTGVRIYSILDTKEVIKRLRYVSDIANELNQDFKKGKISSIDLAKELLKLESELGKK